MPRRPAPVPVPPRLVLNDALVSELQAMARKKVTGALEVIDKAHGGTARLYLYEGGLYSVRLDGYEPRVGARLVASGAITVDDLDRLGEVDDAGLGRESGPRGPAGSRDARDRASGVRARLARCGARAHQGQGEGAQGRRDGRAVHPAPSGRADLRRRRPSRGAHGVDLGGARWGHIAGHPVLRHTSTALPSSMRLPELAALSEAADGASGLDTLAARTGLTRAEAVHLAALLIGAGVLAPVAGVAPEGAGSRLAVPEAFGTVAAVAPVRPQPVPVAEPGPEPAPVPDPEAESDLEPGPGPGPAVRARSPTGRCGGTGECPGASPVRRRPRAPTRCRRGSRPCGPAAPRGGTWRGRRTRGGPARGRGRGTRGHRPGGRHPGTARRGTSHPRRARGGARLER